MRKKEKMGPKIAKGAAALSAAAGAVALGAALSDEETRENVREKIGEAAEAVKGTFSDMRDTYESGTESVAHQVRVGRKKNNK